MTIIIVDVETDGLEQTGTLLEVAGIAVTDNLSKMLGWFHNVVQFDLDEVRAIRNGAVEFVQNMHDNNGLWVDITLPENQEVVRVPPVELARQFYTFCEEIQKDYHGDETHVLRVCGDSVWFDVHHLQQLDTRFWQFFHHNFLDLSSENAKMDLWDPTRATLNRIIFDRSDEKGNERHRAMHDCFESWEKALYQRSLMRMIPLVGYEDIVNEPLWRGWDDAKESIARMDLI